MCLETLSSNKSYHIETKRSIDWFLYQNKFVLTVFSEQTIAQVLTKICLFLKKQSDIDSLKIFLRLTLLKLLKALY